MADCNYCGEPVVWSKTAEGKTLPRSAAPTPACVGLELGRPCLALGVPESSR